MKNDKSFALTLKFAVPISQLYQAIASASGPINWWTHFCDISENVGGISTFRFPKADFFAKIENVSMEPNRLVEWKVVNSCHPKNSGWKDLHDWVGTIIRFKLVPEGEYSCRLEFKHLGLTPKLQCYASCKDAWSIYLDQSLRGWLEQGKGQPYTEGEHEPMIKHNRLTLIREFNNASPEKLFKAFSEPEIMQQWLFPGNGWSVKVANNFQLSGSYEIMMRSSDGKEYLHQGIYRQITPYHKLAFTWCSPEVTRSTVTLFISEIPAGTELTLIHDGLSTEDLQTKHEEVWRDCLDNLERVIAS